jgi:hypothetical protein
MKTRKSVAKSFVILGLAMLLTLTLTLQPRSAKAGDDRTFTLDVAEDCNPATAVVNPANPLEDATMNNSVGDTLVVTGSIFPGGTLHTGSQSNSPADPGSIGQWRSRATLIANWNVQTGFDSSPIAFATMLYTLNNGHDSIMSEGLVPNIGSATKRVLIGGTGAFSGSAGEVRMQNLGTNATGCFNYRFTFKLKD